MNSDFLAHALQRHDALGPDQLPRPGLLTPFSTTPPFTFPSQTLSTQCTPEIEDPLATVRLSSFPASTASTVASSADSTTVAEDFISVTGNKLMANLYDNFVTQSNRVGILAENLSRVNKNYWDLNARYETLRSKYLELLHDRTAQPSNSLSVFNTKDPLSPYSSLSPSDSISEKARTPSITAASSSPAEIPTLIEQPAERPAKYNETVLWEFEDAIHCPHAKVTDANKTRPPVRQCLRTSSGAIIAESLWKNIKQSAARVVRETLHPLVMDQLSDSKVYHKKYFKDHWPREWDDALAMLEHREPILQLCARHWKAELVLAHALDTNAGKVTKLTTSTEAAADPSLAQSPVVPPPQVPPPQPPQVPAQLPSQAHSPPEGLPAQTPAQPTSQALTPPMSQASLLSPIRALCPTEGPSASPLKSSKNKRDPNSPAVRQKKRKCANRGGPGPEVPAVVVPTVAHEETSKVDVSGIKVTASYEALKDIVSDDLKLRSVPHVTDLLEALHKLPETAEASSSPAIEGFVTGIECADPNSPDIDEDDTNQAWGHYQFRSGTVRFDNLTWELVANRKIAYRILAATIKTCRVARHLCFKQSITVDGVVADIYFETIVRDLWKELEKVIEPSSSSDIPGQGSDLSVKRDRSNKLQSLRVLQLKALTEHLELPVAKKKGKATKSDYIAALAPIPPADIDEHLSKLSKNT